MKFTPTQKNLKSATKAPSGITPSPKSSTPMPNMPAPQANNLSAPGDALSKVTLKDLLQILPPEITKQIVDFLKQAMGGGAPTPAPMGDTAPPMPAGDIPPQI